MSQELNVFCPQTNELLQTVAYTGREQMLELVDRACAAQKKWDALPLYERGEILYRFADLLEQEAERIAVLMAKEIGKPIVQARDEAASGSRLLRAAAERAKHLYGEVLTENSPGMEGDLVLTKREPLGVIACVIPFNFPIELTFQKIAPALMMGNAAIVKAPSATPLAVLALAEIAARAGLPEDVVSFVVCERSVMNECIVENPKVAAVSMTGSTGAGRELAARGAATLKRTFLELGGNDAFLIFDDADADRAVTEMITGRMENNGQVCCSPKRFLVQRGIYDTIADRLTARLLALPCGSALEEEAVVTCLVTEKAAVQVEQQINRTIAQGAVLRCGGRREGARILPTVLTDVRAEMDVASDMEIFGPVFPLIPFDTEEEAIRIANQSQFGLSSGLMTANLERAFRVGRQLEAGAAVVNGCGGYRHLDQPFGGYKQSGLGREGTSISLEEFSHIKVYVVKGALR